MPGSAQCIAKLNIIQNKFTSISRKGLMNWSLDTLSKSKEMCPVKTGKLRRSGYTKIIKNTLTEFQVRIGYNTVYAAAVHEIPMYHAVGSMKYLATPFNLQSRYLLKNLENGLRAAL